MSNNNCGCSPTPCTSVPCGCPVYISSDCVNDVKANFPCTEITSHQTLTATLEALDQAICDKFNNITNYSTLVNVGNGSQSYKGVNNLGQKEIRTLYSSDNSVQITQETEKINFKTKQIFIPTPIVYATKGTTHTHSYGEVVPEPITNSWSEELLKLTYQTDNLEFLNYNPRFFLFVYKSHVTSKPNQTTHPNRHKNKKYKKSFIHPPNFSVEWGETNTIVANPAYSKFSNASGDSTYISHFESPFNNFTSEWVVPTKTGEETVLHGFNPLRFYASLGTTKIGHEFFPLKHTDKLDYSTTTSNNYLRFPTSSPNISPRLNLYIKFAIVIDDPNNPGGFIIGDKTDTIKIFPQSGFFRNLDTTIEKYYYTWKTKYN